VSTPGPHDRHRGQPSAPSHSSPLELGQRPAVLAHDGLAEGGELFFQGLQHQALPFAQSTLRDVKQPSECQYKPGRLIRPRQMQGEGRF
jgi:hypothetical protein